VRFRTKTHSTTSCASHKIHGRHTFVAGGQFEFSYDNYLQTNTGGGLISFNGFWTQTNAKGAPSSSPGSDVADFLLGFGLGQAPPWATRHRVL